MAEREEHLIDTSIMPVDEWLSLLENPPADSLFVNRYFPSEEARVEYLATIGQRSEEDVLKLLRHFLNESGTNPYHDKALLDHLRRLTNRNPVAGERLMEHTFYRRLFRHYVLEWKEVLPWEGKTWILDLLPDHPHQALQALNAYGTAHAVVFSDGQAWGWGDAEVVIRAKFIGSPETYEDAINLLLSEGPRTFECLVERLYHEMGYKTVLTPPKKDGGRDVIAWKEEPGHQQRLLVECKLRTDTVGVHLLRDLLGVVSDEKVNKGVLTTNARFTKGGRAFAERNPRLELIPGPKLIPLINEHLGTRWPLRIEALVREAEKQTEKK